MKEQALKSFEKEAKILESLDSEGIVKLQDYFFEDHRGYIGLEHIDGQNLRQLIAEKGALSEEAIRQLAVQMCQILAYLHKRSIIHRDFTPDNLMLTSDNILKLIDFNVAQIQQVGTTGTIAGKHSYLPPEQFQRQSHSTERYLCHGRHIAIFSNRKRARGDYPIKPHRSWSKN
jgi:serine/threonine protein kinase